MTANEISTIITTVGFPIAMCVWFFHWFTTSYKNEQESTREIIEELKIITVELKATIEALTKTIDKGE